MSHFFYLFHSLKQSLVGLNTDLYIFLYIFFPILLTCRPQTGVEVVLREHSGGSAVWVCVRAQLQQRLHTTPLGLCQRTGQIYMFDNENNIQTF